MESGSMCSAQEYANKREGRMGMASVFAGDMLMVMCKLDDGESAAKLPARMDKNEIAARGQILLTMLSGSELSDGKSWTLDVTQTDIITVNGLFNIHFGYSRFETIEAYGLSYMDEIFNPLLSRSAFAGLTH